MVKAVIFDLDDTLISEKQYIESGFQHIAQSFSDKFKKNDQELFQLLMDLFNESSNNVFNRVHDKLGFNYTKKDIVELVNQYRDHVPTISYFNDVLSCLEYLKDRKIKIGIITDGYANSQRQKLMAIKAYDYFDEIIITDQLGREYWKPHPKSYKLMKEKLEVDFSEMIYVGDNPEKDFFISSIYPIKTVRINRNGVYGNRMYLNNIIENYSIYTLTELKLVIKELVE
ncbi:HAD family hydrolase [Pseudoneobacillus rhizosphaerae]|uniref:Pyrophosphatase PpaX n=1 Tax=Pseudoneobacillus rhizosphaerae TaxID=2880968 RepID=A0A9C7L960_9BACI|nr:HAD-IA family hydrolase [Pseudoneobacillus rhizosphaerae]CAG9606597.1 Pyrophosphatase PpaX [Pseudoneobacillus rhizosphaerae]